MPLRAEDLERLSRDLDGELTPEERGLLEQALASNPELRDARARMLRLRALEAPTSDVSPQHAEALFAHVIRQHAQRRPPAPRRSSLRTASRIATVAVAAGLLVGVTMWRWPLNGGEEPRPEVVERGGEGERRRLVQAGADTLRLQLAKGEALLAPGTRVVLAAEDEGLELQGPGTVLLRGQLRARAAAHRFDTNGTALLSTEPSQAQLHVTRWVDERPSQGADMLDILTMWTFRAAALSGTVFFAVMDGEALLSRSDTPTPTHVAAGEHWTDAPGAAAGTATNTVSVPSSRPRCATLGKQLEAPFATALAAVLPEVSACHRNASIEEPALQGEVPLGLRLLNPTGAAEDRDFRLDLPTQRMERAPKRWGCIWSALSKLDVTALQCDGDLDARVAFTFAPDGQVSFDKVGFPKELSLATGLATPDGRAHLPRTDSPSRGEERAPLTVVLFSDFNCSFCAKSFHTWKELAAKRPGEFRLIFRHKPLPSHPTARMAAVASMAAFEQGKFWEFAERLFADQRPWSQAELEAHAAAVGLDVLRFRESLSSGKWEPAIERDLQEALRVGVDATPAQLINGRLSFGALPLEVLSKKLDEESARVSGPLGGAR